jgi:CheY-like chemotaxis protein
VRPPRLKEPILRGAPETGGALILIIEDNMDAGQSLADILELSGHRAHVARDGRSGVELARELRPDVILCDIGLPDLSGYEVARALRSDDALRSTRLIALSGYAQPEDRRRAREAGFDAHIAKPAPLDELAESIAEQVRRR